VKRTKSTTDQSQARSHCPKIQPQFTPREIPSTDYFISCVSKKITAFVLR